MNKTRSVLEQMDRVCSRTPADEYRDSKIRFRDAKHARQWHKLTAQRLRRLCRCHRAGKASFPLFSVQYKPRDKFGWWDVYLWLPNRWWGWSNRWVFTIEVKECFLSLAIEDVRTAVYFHGFQEVLTKDRVELWAWIEQNIDRVLSKPIIEFDTVYTNRDLLSGSDLAPFTEAWLRKWVPELTEEAVDES